MAHEQNVERAKLLIARIDAAIADKPLNVSRFKTFRAELTAALADTASYLAWTLADWSAAIEFELWCIERRRAERRAAA